MTEQTPQETHPLDGVDEWECYDQHIAERNKLTAAKREAEDGFVKTIIQLASGIVLAVPGALTLTNNARRPTILLVAGLSLIGISLISALSEQYLSSWAYDRQIAKTDAYYKRLSGDLSPPLISKWVLFSLSASFVSFILGVLIVSVSLLIGPWRA